jgi:prepilin-type N-terminal cleavage/methylation domain-containing protein
MSKNKAFTLIELLVVISIIALLMAILLPSMREARNRAKRIQCVANLHSLQMASIAYAGSNDDRMPSRDYELNDYKSQPHGVIDINKKLILNEIFFKPYLGDKRDTVCFCPGALLKYRPPSGSYETIYITYQYWNYPPRKGYWIVEQPDMRKLSSAQGKYPVWGCLTAQDDRNGKLPYLSHEMVDGPHQPKGMSTARMSGDAQWVDWEDIEVWWKQSTKRYYWPKP